MKDKRIKEEQSKLTTKRIIVFLSIVVIAVLIIAVVVLIQNNHMQTGNSSINEATQTGSLESNIGDTEKNENVLSETETPNSNAEDNTEDNTEDRNIPSEADVPIFSGNETLVYQIGSDIEIATPYCTLHYPIDWVENVKFVADDQSEKYSVVFIGNIGKHEVNLFSVVFGESTEMPVGTLVMDNGEEITVRLNLDMFFPDDSWTETDISIAYDMIKDSNYLLEELSLLDNFQ